MINRLSVTTIWVKNLNEALQFYTETLGFEIRTDISNGGYRWLTVGLESQPDIEFQLAALEAGGGLDQDEVTQLSRMIETGKLRIGPWKTDDCRKAYESLKAKGVEFIQEPVERPWGTVEAVFKDNSGNMMLLTQDN